MHHNMQITRTMSIDQLSGSLTCAFEAIANPPWSTVAFEAACCVGAGSMSVTVMGSNLALIDI